MSEKSLIRINGLDDPLVVLHPADVLAEALNSESIEQDQVLSLLTEDGSFYFERSQYMWHCPVRTKDKNSHLKVVK